MPFTLAELPPTVHAVNGMKKKVLCCGAATLLFGCARQVPSPAVPRDLTPAPQAADLGTATHRAQPLFSVSAGTVGPHLIRVKHGFTLVWASPKEEGFGLYSSHVNARNTATPPREVEQLQGSAHQLVVEPQAAADTAVLIISSDAEGNHLSVMHLGAEGELQIPPAAIADPPRPILWADIERSATGRLAFWAEQQDTTADLYVAQLSGPRIGAPIQLKRDAVAWQVTEWGGKSAVAVLSRSTTSAKQLLEVFLLDDSASNHEGPLKVAELGSGGFDLDMVGSKDQLLLSWSERTSEFSRLMSASVDLSQRTARVAPATPPRGDQTLLRLASDGSHALVVWEEPHLARADHREVWVGEWSPEKSTSFPVVPQGHYSLNARDQLLPLLSTRGETLAMLAHGKLCVPTESLKCDPRGEDRFFTRLRGGAAAHATPLSSRIASERAQLAWDLRCNPGPNTAPCFALVSAEGDPSEIYLLELGTKDDVLSLAPYSAVGSAVAHVTSQSVVREVPELTRLVGFARSTNTELSWLSYFDPNVPYVKPKSPAPDGRLAPVRALLSVELLPDAKAGQVATDDLTRHQENSISLRARSWGGLGLANHEDQSLLVWAAIDNGHPQMFGTLLDAQGKRTKQKMLTHSPGEIFDATVLATDDGYLVVWVEGTPDGDEVFAMQVDRQLGYSKPLQLSHGARSPMGISIHRVENQMVVAWSDERASTDTAGASLYVSLVDLNSSQPTSEVQVPCGGRSCHSPQWGLRRGAQQDGSPRDQLVLAYLERAPGSLPNQESSEAHLGQDRLVYRAVPLTPQLELQRLGRSPDVVVDVPEVGVYSLWCQESCRVALTSRQEGVQQLWLADLKADSARASFGLSLNTSSVDATTPLLIDDQLYFSDTDRRAGSFRLMRATIAWHAD